MIKERFELRGRVESVLVAATFGSIVSAPAKSIQVIRYHGVRGDNHSGIRLADVREKELLSFGFSEGVEIANYREFSAVSVEELAEVANSMDLPKPIPYGCLGENIVLSGIPKLTDYRNNVVLPERRKPNQNSRTCGVER